MSRLTLQRSVVLISAAAAALILAGCATAGAGTEPGSSDETRTVEHALGTSEIPVDPERIVVLDSAYVLDNVVALGYGDAVVGRVDLNGIGDAVPEWLTEDLDFDEVEFLGSVYPDGVDLEKLAALEPDLVIGVGSAFGEQYDDISKIAPAVAPVEAPGYVVGPWNELTLATGKVLGLESKAKALVSEVEDYLAERIATAPEGMLDRTLTTLGGWTGEPQLYYSGSKDITWMFDTAGFTMNPGFPDSEYELLTPELYGQAESQVIVIADFAAGTIDYEKFFADDPSLSDLTATSTGQLVVIDGLLISSAGPLGQPDAIDAVFDRLTATWAP